MEGYVTCGDCVVLLEQVQDESIDLTVTSPPYDSLRNYESGYTFDMPRLASHLYRVTAQGGVLVWVVGDTVIDGKGESGTSFRQALTFMDTGFYLHDTMIYEKNTSSFPARADSNRYTQIFEYMFVFSKGKPKTANLICDKQNRWNGTVNWGKNTQRRHDKLIETERIKPVPDFSPRNNIWRYVIGHRFNSKDTSAHKHPAIFPYDLAEDHIRTWSVTSDLVLDPFAGSGTTGVASLANNRRFIGFDISQTYCDLANERLKNVQLSFY